MALHYKLAAVLCAFLAILAIMIYMAFCERGLGEGLAHDDFAAHEAQDACSRSSSRSSRGCCSRWRG